MIDIFTMIKKQEIFILLQYQEEREISKIDDDENKEPDYDIDPRMHDGQEK